MTENETNVEATPTDTVDLWITTTNVINFQSLKPQQFGLQKTDNTGLNNLLCEWIRQCQSLITSFTHRDYTPGTCPGAVQNVLLRLVSNMVTLAVQRRDSPIIKVNDWTISTISSDIFSDDLKEDLKPFVKDAGSDYTKVGFFAITGADEVVNNGGSNS